MSVKSNVSYLQNVDCPGLKGLKEQLTAHEDLEKFLALSWTVHGSDILRIMGRLYILCMIISKSVALFICHVAQAVVT